MGKKKSKTSKQKQSKAVSGTSKKFGMTATKGGGREKIAPMILDPKKRQKAKNNSTNKNNKNRSLLRGRAKKEMQALLLLKKKENNEFDRQMKSLQEREATEWNKQSKRNLVAINFTKTSFAVDDKDKSTERLLEETANGVGAMNGIGQQPMQQESMSAFQPTNKLQVLAAHQRAAWADETEEASQLETNNPYAALHQDDSDDDDDDDDELRQQKRQQQHTDSQAGSLFKFMPASFTLATPINDAIDPDL